MHIMFVICTSFVEIKILIKKPIVINTKKQNLVLV